METTIGSDDHVKRMREEHNRTMAIGLSQKFFKAMLDKCREQGVVPTSELRQMLNAFASLCADTAMSELAVIEQRMTVGMDSVPDHLHTASTQEIIDQHVSPHMAIGIAQAMLKAGLVRPVLAIPPTGDSQLTAHFYAWGYAMRQQTGPAGMPAVPRLDYGRGTTVYPRATGMAAIPAMAQREGER